MNETGRSFSRGVGGQAAGKRHSKCMIVDGYNILAKMWNASLREIQDLEGARKLLLEQLAEYQAFCDEQVYLVFDAQYTANPAAFSRWRNVELIYTATRETADQRIERLVYELKPIYHNITVASSDVAEQQVTFGGGALRIPAEELIRRMRDVQEQIGKLLSEQKEGKQKARIADTIRQDLAKIFEKWRRE